MHKAPREPMTPDLTQFMMQCMLSEMKVLTEDEKPFLDKLIEKRVQHCFKYTLEPKLILFLAILCKSPGNCVLYLWYLQMISRDEKIMHFTVEKICEVFPVGFLSESSLREIWNSQKVSWRGSDNMVDHQQAGASLLAN